MAKHDATNNSSSWGWSSITFATSFCWVLHILFTCPKWPYSWHFKYELYQHLLCGWFFILFFCNKDKVERLECCYSLFLFLPSKLLFDLARKALSVDASCLISLLCSCACRAFNNPAKVILDIPFEFSNEEIVVSNLLGDGCFSIFKLGAFINALKTTFLLPPLSVIKLHTL